MSSGNATLSPGCPWQPDYDVFAPEELRDPYPSFKRARQESPIFYSESQRVWLVARQQDVPAMMIIIVPLRTISAARRRFQWL